jgi:hypothetical protein
MPYVPPERDPEELASALEAFAAARRQQRLDQQAEEDRQRAIERQERLDRLAEEARREAAALRELELARQGIFRGRLAAPGEVPARHRLFGGAPRLARPELLPGGTDAAAAPSAADVPSVFGPVPRLARPELFQPAAEPEDFASLIEQGIAGAADSAQKPAVLPGQFVPGLGFSPRAVFAGPATADPNAGVTRIGGLGVARSPGVRSLLTGEAPTASPLAMDADREIPLPPSRLRQLTNEFYIDESLTPEARAEAREAEELATDIEALVAAGIPRGTASAIVRVPGVAGHFLAKEEGPYGGRTREQFFKDLEDELKLRSRFETGASGGVAGASPTQRLQSQRLYIMAAQSDVADVLLAEYPDEATRQRDLKAVLDAYGYSSIEELQADARRLRAEIMGLELSEDEDVAGTEELTPEQRQLFELAVGAAHAHRAEDEAEAGLSREGIRQARQLVIELPAERKRQVLREVGFTEPEIQQILAPFER